jgi:hypothetical protein
MLSINIDLDKCTTGRCRIDPQIITSSPIDEGTGNKLFGALKQLF